MKDAYSTWDEARREMFADFPAGDVRHLLSDFMEGRFRHERQSAKRVPTVLLGWTPMEYCGANGPSWHDMGWCEFGKVLHRALCGAEDNPLRTLESALTINGVLDFEDKFEEFAEFVQSHERRIPCGINDNARRLRDAMRGIESDVRLLHDRATILMTLASAREGSGISFEKEDRSLRFAGVYECDRTVAQLLDEVDGARAISESIERIRRRGRPRTPGGPQKYLPSEAKRLAAIAIVEALRSGKADTQTSAVEYCKHHCKEYAGANFGAFEDLDARTLRRWAAYNGTTVADLRKAQAVEWEEIKKSLK